MRNIILFCQAPGDIKCILDLYEKNRNDSKISIFCINVEGMFQFLKGLHLDLDALEFITIKQYPFKNPLKFFLKKAELKKIQKKYFKNKVDNEVYFFAIWYDWITFYVISELAKNNKIFYIRNYQGVAEAVGKKSPKDYLLSSYFYFLTGVKFKFAKEDGRSILMFPYKYYGITENECKIESNLIFERYSFKIVSERNENYILLIENDLTSYNIIKNYKKEIYEVILKLKNDGFKIAIKGHPRLGFTNELLPLIDFSIPNNVPAEFINLDNVNNVVGLISISLAFFAKRFENVYSIMNDFEFVSPEMKAECEKYLKMNSDDKIKFKSLKNEHL